MDEIKTHIDFLEMWKYVKGIHLDTFPTVERYIEEYFMEYLDREPTKLELGWIGELYGILLNSDSFFKEVDPDIDYESSEIDTNSGSLTITLVDDRSTNTEAGFCADFSLWIFDVNTDLMIFSKYKYDN